MKKILCIIGAVYILATFGLLSGCNNKNAVADDDTLQTAGSVESTGNTSALSTQPTQPTTEPIETEETQMQYTQEENELEIIPGNDSDNVSDETIAETPKTESATEQKEETFPQLDDIIDEPIELPFVPIG